MSVFVLIYLLALVVLLVLGYWLKYHHFIYYRGPSTDHFDGKTFSNYTENHHRGLLDFLKWRLLGNRAHWPEHLSNKLEDMPPSRVEGNNIRVSMIGHATVLIQTQGMNLITDPVYAEKAGPLGLMGPKRVVAPGVKFENLPKIDAILLSHNHYDHMDIVALKAIVARDKAMIITPLGNDVILKRQGINSNIVVLDWHQNYPISPDINIILTPAEHWSSRYGMDKNRALWGGFIVQSSGGYAYFAGDTGYGDGGIFRAIKEKYGIPKIAILPIGAYEPRWFMKIVHINPEDAVKAFIDLGKPKTLGIHFGVFQLTDEAYNHPMHKLSDALDALSPREREHFKPFYPGEVCEVK